MYQHYCNTNNFDPWPSFDCDHIWVPIGEIYQVWTSTDTNSDAPEDAPKYQKQQCSVCQGVQVNLVNG